MNITLITSIINTPPIPLSYTNTRSIYNKDERFEQTKKTIATIKEKIPSNKIMVVECSQLTKEEPEFFKENTDIFLNLCDTNDMQLINRMFTQSKAMGEGTMTIFALHHLFTSGILFNNLFKISGRYWLTNEFNYEEFINNYAVFKYIDEENVITSLYKLPFLQTKQWYNYLLFSEKKFIKAIAYERIFLDFLQTIEEKKEVDNKIGIAGNIAVSGELKNF